MPLGYDKKEKLRSKPQPFRQNKASPSQKIKDSSLSSFSRKFRRLFGFRTHLTPDKMQEVGDTLDAKDKALSNVTDATEGSEVQQWRGKQKSSDEEFYKALYNLLSDEGHVIKALPFLINRGLNKGRSRGRFANEDMLSPEEGRSMFEEADTDNDMAGYNPFAGVEGLPVGQLNKTEKSLPQDMQETLSEERQKMRTRMRVQVDAMSKKLHAADTDSPYQDADVGIRQGDSKSDFDEAQEQRDEYIDNSKGTVGKEAALRAFVPDSQAVSSDPPLTTNDLKSERQLAIENPASHSAWHTAHHDTSIPQRQALFGTRGGNPPSSPANAESDECFDPERVEEIHGELRVLDENQGLAPDDANELRKKLQRELLVATNGPSAKPTYRLHRSGDIGPDLENGVLDSGKIDYSVQLMANIANDAFLDISTQKSGRHAPHFKAPPMPPLPSGQTYTEEQLETHRRDVKRQKEEFYGAVFIKQCRGTPTYRALLGKRRQEAGKGFHEETDPSLLAYIEDQQMNTGEAGTSGNCGHTFVRLKQKYKNKLIKQYSFGFFPTSETQSAGSVSTGAVFNPDPHSVEGESGGNDILDEKEIKPADAFNAVSYIRSVIGSVHSYAFSGYNCTSFGLEVAKAAGMHVRDNAFKRMGSTDKWRQRIDSPTAAGEAYGVYERRAQLIKEESALTAENYLPILKKNDSKTWLKIVLREETVHLNSKLHSADRIRPERYQEVFDKAYDILYEKLLDQREEGKKEPMTATFLRNVLESKSSYLEHFSDLDIYDLADVAISEVIGPEKMRDAIIGSQISAAPAAAQVTAPAAAATATNSNQPEFSAYVGHFDAAEEILEQLYINASPNLSHDAYGIRAVANQFLQWTFGDDRTFKNSVPTDTLEEIIRYVISAYIEYGWRTVNTQFIRVSELITLLERWDSLELAQDFLNYYGDKIDQ